MSSVPVESPLSRLAALDLAAQEGTNKVASTRGYTYSEYLKLDKLLSCQELLSAKVQTVPAEHLFIITHQAYELWFRQILYDLDIIRHTFMAPTVDETLTLRIVSGLDRIVRIMKLLVDQVLILETMYPLDFVEFRKYLAPGSGFQSLQFRLIENKLGIRNENRVKYNAENYRGAFKEEDQKRKVMESETEPSLCDLVQAWLERTPGMDDYNFWPRYRCSVEAYLKDMLQEQEDKTLDPAHLAQAQAEFDKTKQSFESILDEQLHMNLMDKGERRLSHRALQGAMLISFYRDQPRFSQPYQILSLLMDIDSLFTKWRYNHVMLVQRMLGSKHGSGGSSGYMYLRSTVSDRYKVFLDLFNLSTWLIPRAYIPILTPELQLQLSHAPQMTPDTSDTDDVAIPHFPS